MEKRQSDKKTKQIRVNTELHKILRLQAAKEGKTMKTLLEEYLKYFLVS